MNNRCRKQFTKLFQRPFKTVNITELAVEKGSSDSAMTPIWNGTAKDFNLRNL